MVRSHLGLTDARDADFTGAVLFRAIFNGADLLGADFTDAELLGVSWQSCRCPDGTLSPANGQTCVGHLE